MSSSMFDLTGRVALVTGGSKGLGKAMARCFVEHGADVVISSRSEKELKAALEEILAGTNRKGAYFVADMTDRSAADKLGKAAIEKMGRVDILINNAGSNVPEPCDKITDENWDKIVELNLSSCMAMTRAVVPGMKERKWGRIVYISSVMGLASKAARNSYSATKAAVIGLARANALDLGEYGITANCIAPGPFMTDLPMSVLSEPEKKAFADQTAMNRWGDPKELTGAALLLSSDAGSYITGTTIVVDGGMLVKLS